jgi:hypothetical protein
MFRLLIGFVFLIVLTGCASTPNPLDKVSNLSKKDLKQVVSIIYGNGENDERFIPDQTENFNFWRINTEKYFTRLNFAEQRFEKDLKKFDQYCLALGGIFVTPYVYPYTGSPADLYTHLTQHPTVRTLAAHENLWTVV